MNNKLSEVIFIMGIFKAIGKFFEALDQEENSKNQVPRKSPEELAKEEARKKERERYNQEYKLRRDLEKHEELVEELHEKAASQWEKAKTYMKQGQRNMAETQLSAHKQTMALAMQMQRRTMAFEVKIAAIQSAGSAMEMTKLLGQYAQSLGLEMSPAEIGEAFGDVDLLTATVDEIDNVLEKQLSRDAKKMKDKEIKSDSISDSEAMQALEAEIAGEMAAKSATTAIDTNNEKSSIQSEIDAGLKELQQLIDDTQKK